ncbi:MAG: hypothetical protein K8H86_10900 [Ignavibacteriaceae bacterium]|nr:hypothetical protein [Ignavibacteriaceae bacterium]
MRIYRIIILSIIVSIYFVSCSFISSTNNDERDSPPNIITTNFLIIAQDTISFSNEVFNYSLLVDSIGRKFYVLEDGCSNIENELMTNVGVKDTIYITITATRPRRFDKISKNEFIDDPSARIIIAIENELAPVYQSERLCNHKLIFIK